MKRGRKLSVLTVLLAALVLVIGVIAAWRASVVSANNDRLRAIAARGEPTSLAELDKIYKAVPESQNAALLWLSGVAALEPNASNSVWSEVAFPHRGTLPEDEHVQLARRLMSSNAPALAIFRQAAGLTNSRYPVDLSEPLADLPHLSEVRSAANVLRMEALVALEDGDIATVVEDTDRMLAAGRSLASEPTILSQLVRFAIDSLAFQTLQYTLNRASLRDADLLRLFPSFSRADDTNSLALALIGERASFISNLSDLGSYVAAGAAEAGIAYEPSVVQRVFHPLVGSFFQRDMRFGIDALSTNIAFARLGDPQKFLSYTNSSGIASRAKSGYYILSGFFLPMLEKAFTRDAIHRAQVRAAIIALAIERFRLANGGKPPQNLLALVPAYLDRIPVDPYDGQLVRYKKTDKGYIVYCIGADGRDDGGAERVPKAPKGSPEDVTFVVERRGE